MKFRIKILALLSSTILICSQFVRSESEFYAPVVKGYEGMPYHLRATKNTNRIKLGTVITETNHMAHITGVYDGMFGVLEDNGCWAFYSVAGNKVFDAEWTRTGTEFRFGSGALLMTKGNTNELYILYKDGTTKVLGKGYNSPSNFVDGVALVNKEVDITQIIFGQKVTRKGYKWTYINTKGEDVFTNINVAKPERGDNTEMTLVSPICDGLRLFAQAGEYGDNLYGYMDKDGVIKIKPQYPHAHDFSDGLALVWSQDKGWHFITPHGNVAYEPKWPPYTQEFQLGDYHDGYMKYCPKNYSDDQTIFFDKLGNKVYECEYATSFYGGYAWTYYSYDYDKNKIINQHFEKYDSQIPMRLPLPNFYRDYGVAHYGQDMNDQGILPSGRILLEGIATESRFYSFTPEGYALAVIKEDGEAHFGFINKHGEFLVLFL